MLWVQRTDKWDEVPEAPSTSVTVRRPVTPERAVLKPDWFGSRRWFSERQEDSWL